MKKSMPHSPETIQAHTENQMSSRTKERCLRPLIALSVAALCALCSLFIIKLYTNNDNYQISLIVNGLYDDAGQCQLLHPLLGRGLHRLSMLLPGADVFMLAGHVFVFLEIFWLSDLLLREKKSPLLTLAFFSLFVFASVGLKLFNANFTIQAGSFAMTGMVTLAYAQRRKVGWPEILIGTLFFALGFMWRKQGALLAVPFILLETAVNLLGEADHRAALKRACLVLAPCLFLTGLLILTDAAMNADEVHRLAREYTDSRATICDYPMLSWEEVSGRSDGEITKTDYLAAQYLLLLDTERMTADMLKKIAALGSVSAYHYTPAGVLGAVRSAGKMIGENRLILLTSVLLSALTLWGVIKLPGYRRLELVLDLLGSAAILLYFIIRGRAPERFWITLLILPLGLALLNLVLEGGGEGESSPRVLACVLLMWSVCALASVAPGLYRIKPQLAINARQDVDLGECARLMEDDNLYVWQDAGNGAISPIMRQGKLLPRAFLEKFIFTGGWEYGQPYFTSYLERIGVPNPAQALLERDDVLLISDFPGPVLALLAERAQGEIEAEPFDNIMGYNIFTISVKSDA